MVLDVFYKMPEFKKSQIKQGIELVAHELKKARQEKEISFFKAAKDTKINIKYIEALESGDFERIPKGVYRRNFLREYSDYLGVDSREILKTYNQYEDQLAGKRDNPFSRRLPKGHYFLTIPNFLKNFLIVILVFSCFIYLGYYVKNIITPPNLIIINPKSDITTKEKAFKVEGKAEPEIEITINEDNVLQDKEGFFSQEVYLKEGLNTIIIKAKKKYSRTNTVIRKILVENE